MARILNGTDWRLMLIPLLAMVVIAMGVEWRWEILMTKRPAEVTALVLTGAAVAVCGFRVLVEDNPLVPLLFAFCLAFFLREIHFAGTSKGVYIAAALIAYWAWRWRDRLGGPVSTGRFKAWLFAAGWAYFLALLVQRRFFKHVFPDELLAWEQALVVPMEEWLEVVAHTLLLIMVFSGFSGRLKSTRAQR